ncbi:ACS family tartrate transporter-like MFS transporter [Arthrobacter sp. V4I6]|uniref:MFS transporter n=1 Tax=unclassified Arthrobacter TaxID=235627 RepID=UPI0027861AAF|nr:MULTISPECIES: MFS transporter [unclassified Arthrobacter]MDQ0821540.1 ACS family tartrate transporter-like MFS transporter [Arthrobacter sp. V1I7]MDQ0855805.1 ACS family tartrate transporter-like MFS transporter [Arthrobacter sp. V4I6]
MQAIATRKAIKRLIPLLGICFFISIIDRTNVSVASLTMNADIGMSAAAYGFGAGIFFIGYFLFEVPSNLALAKYGARRWIARIMITWGVISMAMYFISNETTFYIFRFLLGAAEAGFFPGVVFFLYQWFDQKNIAKVLATFFAFGPLANAVGAPLATAIMSAWGWQWVFVVEGIPAIILAFVVLRILPDSIEDAKWLTAEEKVALRSAVAKPTEHVSWVKALRDPQTMLMCLQYFLIMTSSYALVLWLPQVIKSLGADVGLTGWLTAIPFAAAAVGMVLWGRHSSKTGERIWHTVIPCIAACLAFAVGAYTKEPVLALALLSVAATAVYAAPSAFWSLPRTYVSGAVAATATALANSFGNLGGFVGPYLNGWMRDLTGGFELGLALLGIPILLGGLLTFITARMASPKTESQQTDESLPAVVSAQTSA